MRLGALRFLIPAAGFAAVALAAGCVTPSVNKQVTTLGQVDMTGMVCRRAAPTGSSLPKTVCATQAAWDREDARAIAFSEKLHEESNRQTNTDPFGRMRN